MSKERRLGRGLEALLGQLPVRNEPAPPAQQQRSAAPSEAAPTGVPLMPTAKRGTGSEPTDANAARNSGSEVPVPLFQQAPSAEALFRLDIPHAAAGQFVGQPHHPPSHQPAAAAQPTSAAQEPAVAAAVSNAPLRVDVHQIDRNPSQPRKEFAADDMQALAESITAHGLLQPVVVRRVHDRYQLVAGERRLRAAIKAGWVDVPVNVVEADDRQMAELAIVENLQRKDLNALEKAASFQKYLDEYGCTQEELAGRLKLDRSTIANLIRLLELPEGVQDAIRRGKITQGHARALLPLGDEQEQVNFCQRIQREGLNVRQTEVLVQETIDTADHEPLSTAEASEKSAAKSPRAKNDHIAALEQEFRTALGMKVKISHNARGRGKLVVQFRNHEEFERLKKHVCGG